MGEPVKAALLISKLTRLFLLVCGAASISATAADLIILAPNAAKEAVLEAVARFENASGDKVIAHWSGTEAITKRIGDGEVVDVVINASQNIDRLIADRKLFPDSRTDFARSSIGVAVSPSSPNVDVSSIEGLKSALISATSIVISSGTSGRYLSDLFVRLGIGEQVKSKIKQPPSGTQIGDFLAADEAELGFQQVSELIHVKGIRYLGALPAEIQSYTVYSGAIHAQSPRPEAAGGFLNTLRNADIAAIVKASGMDPL
jgi:molybdate transport system substrate-binding protein